MQILTLELENVKSYERAQIAFSQGVNAIVGHNGAGKSTILEAIGFTLFDALDYNQTDFIRGGAKSARVRVTFVSSDDERAYDVERRIGTSARYSVHDPQLGATICEGKADVLRFLRQHLQVEANADLSSIFKDAVGVPQGTLTAAFLLNATERKRIFESLLRVEEYARVSDKLREPVNLLKARKGEVGNEISRLQGRLERQPTLETEIAERKQTIATTTSKLGAATQELDAVQIEHAKLESGRIEVDKARGALGQTQTKLESVTQRRNDAERARVEAESAKDLVTANQAGCDAYIHALNTYKVVQERVQQRQQIEVRRAEADKRAALFGEQLRQRQRDLEEVDAAEKTVLELQDSVDEWNRLKNDLAIAEQQQARLQDAKLTVAQQQESLERYQARLTALQHQLDEAKTVESEIQSARVQSETSRRKLDSERDTLAHLKSQAELIKEQSQKLEDIQSATCPVCEQPLTAQHRTEMLARNNSRLEQMRASYRDASKQVQTLETTLQQEQNALEKWQSALLQLPRADEAHKLSEEVARIQVQLDQAQSQVATLAGAAQAVEDLRRSLDALGDPNKAFNVAGNKAGQRKTLEKQLAQAGSDLEAAQRELAKYQAQVDEFGDLDTQLQAVNVTLDTHKSAYEMVQANRNTADLLDARRHAAQTLAQEVTELSQLQIEQERQFQAASAKFDAAAYDHAMARMRELQTDVGTLAGQLDLLSATQAKDERELLDLHSLGVVVAEKEGRMKRLVDEEDVLETIRGKLRQAGPYISEALNRQISEGARQIFSELMQDYTRNLTWNKDYSISLEVDGRERNFSQLSGGEQMSAALSVRLALLREMSSIDIAFFDEPTANLDETRREALARQILNVRGFRQLFVISHDDTFEQAMQNLIRVERVGGTSRIMAT